MNSIKITSSLSKREAMRGNLFSIGGKGRFPSLCFLYLSRADARQSPRLLFHEEQLPAPILSPGPLSVRVAFPHKQDPPTTALGHAFLSRRHSWRSAGACPGDKENFLAVRSSATTLGIFAIDCVLFLEGASPIALFPSTVSAMGSEKASTAAGQCSQLSTMFLRWHQMAWSERLASWDAPFFPRCPGKYGAIRQYGSSVHSIYSKPQGRLGCHCWVLRRRQGCCCLSLPHRCRRLV